MTAANPTVTTPNGTAPVDGVFNAGGNFQPAHLPATTAMNSSNATSTGSTANEAVEIVAYSATRRTITICNRTAGSETIDIGPAGVAVGAGIPIVAGGDRTFTGPGVAGPIYAVSPAENTPISWVDA
jgi:hypothetical protein